MQSPKKAMYAIYAIKSIQRERIFIRQTQNIEERVALQNAGRLKATKVERLWQLFAVQTLTAS
jgi:hypothetical protein